MSATNQKLASRSPCTYIIKPLMETRPTPFWTPALLPAEAPPADVAPPEGETLAVMISVEVTVIGMLPVKVLLPLGSPGIGVPTVTVTGMMLVVVDEVSVQDESPPAVA